MLFWMKYTLTWFRLRRNGTENGLSNIKDTFAESFQLQISVLHQSACLQVSSGMCIFKYVCLQVSVSSSMCVFKYMCLQVCVSSSKCVLKYVCLQVCVSSNICIFKYVCLQVCVSSRLVSQI